MKKSDLKNKMVVEFRNTFGKYFVVDDLFISENGYMSFRDVDDSLNAVSGNKEWDIMKVFKVSFYANGMSGIFGDTSNDRVLELLWERKELPSLTDDEKVILKNVSTNYKWIARDKDNTLRLYGIKPKMSGNYYELNSGNYYELNSGYASFTLYQHLFKDIQFESGALEIKELLK